MKTQMSHDRFFLISGGLAAGAPIKNSKTAPVPYINQHSMCIQPTHMFLHPISCLEVADGATELMSYCTCSVMGTMLLRVYFRYVVVCVYKFGTHEYSQPYLFCYE